MKLLVIIPCFLILVVACGQTTIIERQEKKRAELATKVKTGKTIGFVKIVDQTELIKVVDQNLPDNVELIYNILKNEKGQVIYVSEYPISQSGDWDFEAEHFFDDNGRLVAFEQRLAWFNEDCADGAVVEKLIVLFDENFNIIKSDRTLTDNEGKPLKQEECGNPYDREVDKRSSVSELLKLKGIPVN